MEQLQQVLFNLTDLAAKQGQAFQGVVLDGVEFHYREQDATVWRISIEQIVAVKDGRTITAREAQEAAGSNGS